MMQHCVQTVTGLKECLRAVERKAETVEEKNGRKQDSILPQELNILLDVGFPTVKMLSWNIWKNQPWTTTAETRTK
jgi:hypothetical protein